MRRAALFDLDRTLVRENTAKLFIRHQRRTGQASLLAQLHVAWWLAKYTLGVLDAEVIAAKVLSGFRGIHETVFAARCEDWCLREVFPYITDSAKRTVRLHQEAGDLCAIVTGASPYTARPVAQLLGIEHVIASELECDREGYFTGNPVAPLCYGKGKIERSRKLASNEHFMIEQSVFYTDSITDLPLLECVGEPVVVNGDPRLRHIAKKRMWRQEQWL